MANIKNNNYRKIECCLIKDNYLDLMLSKDDVKPVYMPDNCIATKLTFNNIVDKHVVSDIAWEKSIKSDNILKNIGYTGVDNGFISYERDMIGNDEFLELYTNSEFDLSKFGDKFFVTEVDGNTNQFSYEIEKNDDYVSLKGGFYQGFFKIHGDDYQTLPYRIKNEWNFNLNIRPKNYSTKSNILNKRHSENEGMFFFIGSRAENKFFELYKKTDEINEYLTLTNDDYSIDYDMTYCNIINTQYLNTDVQDEITDNTEDIIPPVEENEPENENNNTEEFYDDYFLEAFNPYSEHDELNHEHTTDYFIDDYQYTENENNNTEDEIVVENGVIFQCVDGILEDGYILPQMDLSNIELEDSKSHPLDEKGFYEFNTDNKFIIFNRTNDGFTKNTWNDMYEYIITGKTDTPSINYYPYLNRTNTGYTIDNVDELKEQFSYAYDIFKDIENNALGFKLNKDGSISYRYLSKNCELIEETSKPNIVTNDEWNNIHIKLKRKPNDDCDDYTVPAVMQIFIYVNGYLKLVSKELPELMLTNLNDCPEKQEAVPYNLSIGGGSQGLCERIMLDYYDISKYELPIEKNFAGTFIGDIKDFTFISCPIDFSIISKNNVGF